MVTKKRRDGKIRRLARGSAVVVGAGLVTVLLMEGVTRLSGYSKRYLCDPVFAPFPEAAEIPYVLKPDLRHALAPTGTVFSTDSLGLRSPDGVPDSTAADLRIAVVGDSVTFGQGVATADTFCEVLQAELREARPDVSVRVFNFGVPGYSVREMAASVRGRVAAVEPDLAMMCVIFSDFEVERCGVVDRWGYLHNRKQASYDHPDALRYLLLRHFHLTYLVRDLVVRYEAGRPARNGGPSPPLLPGELPAAYPYLGQFADAAVELAIEPLVVTLPTIQHDGSELRAVTGQLEVDGVPFLDLTGLRRELSDEAFRVSPRDGHPSAAVHRRIGEELAGAVLDLVD